MHPGQRAMPEHYSFDSFVTFLESDERASFTTEDLLALNFKTHTPTHELRSALESKGFRLTERLPARRVRGFRTSSHDRWYGPGSGCS